LGRLTEPMVVPVLEEWVHPKGILDRLRDKSDAVKRAALQALGQYKSQQVRLFLEHCAEHLDKDLRKDALEALRSVTERLSET
jgi:HEAT repeat protein